MKKITFTLSIFILLSILFSCSPSLRILMKDDNSTEFNVAITNTESFFSNFSAFMDFSEDNFYDDQALQLSLQDLGFTDIFIETNTNTDIKINAQIQNQNFADEENPLSTLISIAENNFTIKINPTNIIELLCTIPEITDYLDLLMAPIYTGEELSESEYLELFASVYGESFAKDFENTNLLLQIEVLQNIKQIQTESQSIGTVEFSNKTAKIKIPLYKLLCKQDLTSFKIEF